MAPGPTAFYCLWQEERIREKLFNVLSKEDICSVRLANSACCNLVTKRLFLRTHLTFTANTFTKPSRIQALSRVGHHIEHLTFQFAHSPATFLPPLIHPETGREIFFLYSPHTSMASVLARPKYANSELGEILMQQYPPLFHAASNVPSFINAVKHMPNMRHLTIKTPGQDPKERYRRDIVDYALISLRIAVERTLLPKLTKLSLSGVHPAALNYLRHVPGFGASPSAARRWRQIRKLHVAVESWDFYGPEPGLDQLKILDDYIRQFAPQLDKFTFAWLGRCRGPCPLALAGDPLFSPPRSARKLFHEVTGPMSPLPTRPQRQPLVMPRLRYMQVRNATMNVAQVRALAAAHRATVREFDFENVVLVGGGSWDEALAPLMEGRNACGGGKEEGRGPSWSRHSITASESSLRVPRGLASPGPAVAPSLEDLELPSPSAAAAAASKELFEVDLDGMAFGGANDVDALEANVEQWARGVTVAHKESIAEADEETGSIAADDYSGLPSDVEAARQASMVFGTGIKKQQIRKRRMVRRHRHDKDGTTDDERDRARDRREHRSGSGSGNSNSGGSTSGSRHRSRSRHKHSRSDETQTQDRDRPQLSRSDSSRSAPHRYQRLLQRRRDRHSDDAPPLPAEMPSATSWSVPEVVGSDDEREYVVRRPETPMDISAPIMDQDPLPVLLLPTVYDPSARAGPDLGPGSYSASGSASSSSPSRRGGADASTAAAGAATAASSNDDSLLSAAQRSIEAELRAEAEDAAARSSALKRARAAVLTKLSREFCRLKTGPNGAGISGSGSGGIYGSAHTRNSKDKDSAAVAHLPNLSLAPSPLITSGGHGSGNNYSGSSSGGGWAGAGQRLRDGLFGRSGSAAAAAAAAAAASMGMAAAVAAATADHRSMESQSALVPLMFSRG